MSDPILEATKTFASAFHFDKVQPHGESLEEMMKSTRYLESSPITFTYSFDGPREANPFDLYKCYLDFLQKNQKYPELKQILFPLFCKFIINFKLYGDDKNCHLFKSKYLDTIPQEYAEEVNLFLTDDSHYDILANKISTQSFIFKCSGKTADVLVNFINEPHNSQLRAIITELITIRKIYPTRSSQHFNFLEHDKPDDLSILTANAPGCSMVAMPRSGPYVYAAFTNNTIVRLETETHTSRIIGKHKCPITTLSTSQHGNVCVSGDAVGYSKVWSKNNQAELPVVSCPIWCSAFAPEGGCFGIGYDDFTACLFSSETCKAFRCLVAHTGAVTDIAFHPNCSLVATASTDNSVRLWDIRMAESVRLFIAKDKPTGLSMSPDGKSLSFYDGVVKLCDLGTGDDKGMLQLPAKELAGINFIGNGTNVVAVTPNGSVYSVDFDENIVKDITSVDAKVIYCGTSQINELRIVTSE